MSFFFLKFWQNFELMYYYYHNIAIYKKLLNINNKFINKTRDNNSYFRALLFNILHKFSFIFSIF